MSVCHVAVRSLLVGCCCLWLIALIACSPARPAPGHHQWRQLSITYCVNKEASILSETTIRTGFGEWSIKTPLEFTYGGRHRAGLHRR